MPEEKRDGTPPRKRPTSQPDQDTHAFRQYRRHLDEEARATIPLLDPVVTVGTVLALAAAMGLAFAPWIRFVREDGTTGSTSALRGDGLMLILAASVGIGALVTAFKAAPGEASFPAMIGFIASVVGLIVVGFTLLDPRFVHINEPELPVSVSRDWGLPSAFLVMVVAVVGSWRLWRMADYY